VSANRISLEVEVDVHVLTEATRVIVSVRFGVTKRFQDAVRLQENVLDTAQHEAKITDPRWFLHGYTTGPLFPKPLFGLVLGLGLEFRV